MPMAEDQSHTAPTLFLLMAQYNSRTVVPLDQVCRDFFGHHTVEKLLRRALRGDIVLPIVRIETSQKAQRGVHLVDLAAYIDKRRAAAVKECHQLAGTT
jgi:Pyocin activator protein PrtN